MAQYELCSIEEAPATGAMIECTVAGRTLCLANDGGRLAAIDNVCPHRQGPLAEGSLEGGQVLCPWHAWAFDLKSGKAEHDENQTVEVFKLEIQGDRVLVTIED